VQQALLDALAEDDDNDDVLEAAGADRPPNGVSAREWKSFLAHHAAIARHAADAAQGYLSPQEVGNALRAAQNEVRTMSADLEAMAEAAERYRK